MSDEIRRTYSFAADVSGRWSAGGGVGVAGRRSGRDWRAGSRDDRHGDQRRLGHERETGARDVNQAQVNALSLIANQAAVAIHNANLYNSLQTNYLHTIISLVNALEAVLVQEIELQRSSRDEDKGPLLPPPWRAEPSLLGGEGQGKAR